MSQSLDRADYIYHITTPERWNASADASEYHADSLQSEGFIHCSTERQIERSLNKFFRGHQQVTILTLDPALLASELKYEPADGDSFPHIYGPINTDAVVARKDVEPEEDGTFRLNLN
jgi:uncharacterized protein (DUF952 family)